jgi:polyhydroxybutyrate depolymerase
MKPIRALILAICMIGSAQALSFDNDRSVLIGPTERLAKLKLPKNYDPDREYPLILMLHGRGSTAALTDLYLGLSRNQNRLEYLLLLPEGNVRDDGQTYWNATPECCDIDGDQIDDAGYLRELVLETTRQYSVDPAKIYVYGHSNGGFMAYRLACDNTDLFQGIISVAGSTFGDNSLCQTQTPISILQVHGTDDTIVPYKAEGKDYPSAPETVKRWATRFDCRTKIDRPNSRDLILFKIEPGLDEDGNPTIVGDFKDYVTFSWGNDTDERLYKDCQNQTRIALWTVRGAHHAPLFLGKYFIDKSLNFLKR